MTQTVQVPVPGKARERRHQGIYDAIVVGGGLVGAAIAYGLSSHLGHIAVLDEGDVAYRASRGNFGLVWVQSKGMGMPAYGQWTMSSQQLWRQFADDLLDLTGVDVHLEQHGGLHVLLTEEEVEARIGFLTRLHAQPGMAQYPWKMLDHKETADLVPGLGPEVLGASWTPVDGIANPLKLLHALHVAFDRLDIDYLPQHPATKIAHKDGIFEIDTPRGTVRARKLVLASGLSNKMLGEKVGLDVPVRPQRGQIIVLERTRRLLETPIGSLRQMDEGTWLIGDSQEEMGYADQTTGLPVLATLADRAVRTIPALREVRIVRSWAALRVMSQDGFPIYEESQTHPGAFVATCHSGVTLAAAHALRYAPMVAAGCIDDDMIPFSTRRFHVQKAA
ncbi:NAD(P)/FAD-dependent oxidoreductase [Paralcaligenes ureilyticus]|uniref:Glycine/D-amino acid oxidase-like deaminating enzyme n=1 Tax=Paralcaligenes ureilyticus TaxID=627131 RepID=A0A4V2UZE6_9BURK|nr:FAD-dependent oxidoreductase [Paralcaligenes ureilyticus]TCT11028.1 glycine/D-amino acid oxidase-like deaminating enzyme [Paralcaligenes ureilyticus]